MDEMRRLRQYHWNSSPSGLHRAVSAYFCHNSYVAEVLDIKIVNDKPVVENVYAAVDCCIVINPDAATNMRDGEPLFPPIFAALANAIYKSTGKRQYNQPIITGLEGEDIKIL